MSSLRENPLFGPTSAAIAGEATALFAKLDALPHLKPSPEVNDLFNRVVALSGTPAGVDTVTEVLARMEDNGVLTGLRSLCARGEGELETYWADKLACATDVEAMLEVFPYLQEYRELVAKEVALIRGVAPHAGRILFAGSGPLPLSALLMAREHGMRVDMFDCDDQAHACAMNWLARIEGWQLLACRHADIRDVTDTSAYDVVCLAALAGVEESTKREILAHLKEVMRPGQVLLVRSADALRRMLYRDVPVEWLDGFTVADVWHPRGGVVNSVIVAVRE